MNVHVQQLDKEQWKTFSENAHKIAFGEVRPAHRERIDYALVAIWGKELVGYVTVRELDSESVYWQFGGGLPPGLKTVRIWKGYKAFLDWTEKRYKRMTTLIENTNVPMLKLAMMGGLRIIGVRNYNGSILLEHGIDF